DPVDRRDLPIDRKLTADRLLLTLPIYRGGIHLPKGVVPGQRIWELLTRLTWSVHGVHDFRRLPIPFAAVATDVETGQAVVLDQGFLPDAIRANMALPSVFAPVELGRAVLIDGGVVRNLPAQDARALGADVLICSDVTDPLEPRDSIVSLVDVLVQAVSFRVWDSERAQRGACDVLIVPDVRAFTSFGFGRAAELMARGEAAARAALPEIEAKVGRRRVGPRPPAPAAPDSVLVTGVRFDVSGGGTATPAFLAHALGLTPPARPLGEGQSVTLGAALAYAHQPVDLFRDGRRVAEVRVDLGAVSASLERRLGSGAGVALRVKAEHSRWAEAVAAVDSAPINRSF